MEKSASWIRKVAKKKYGESEKYKLSKRELVAECQMKRELKRRGHLIKICRSIKMKKQSS